MLLYSLIFFSKIAENTLSTLRIIVVANGKKVLGAILQGLVALIWIFVTGAVIVNVGKDPLKVLFFCLGTVIGSYLGSLIEEKIALGNNILLCIVKNKYIKKIKKDLDEYNINTLNEKDNIYSILLIYVKRIDVHKTSFKIKSIDKDAIIISEKAKNIV